MAEQFTDPKTNQPIIQMGQEDTQRSRSNQISRRDDNEVSLTVGLQDIDSVILYYFNEVIRPSVLVNNVQTPVPIIYASPEKWKAVQKDGYYRDKDGKRQLPVILFKRDSLDRVRNITSKVNANNPANFYTPTRIYTDRNRYSNPEAANSRVPERAYIYTVVPDFVKMTYSCTILTDLISQANSIIEAINFASDSFWGRGDSFKFQTFIDSFKTEQSTNNGEDRTIKTTFSIKLNGYVLPGNAVNSAPYTNFKRFSPTHTRISITERTE